MYRHLKDKQNILAAAARVFPEAAAIRRDLHRHPERSNQEFRTAALISEKLTEYGLEPRRVRETGVYAELKGTVPDGPVIILRADIDALPIQEESGLEYSSVNDQTMHACGHDMHTAALLGAARVLTALEEPLKTTVRFFFQQAEEIGDGAKHFIEAGLTEGADRAFGIHITPYLPTGRIALVPGPLNAAVDHFELTFRGQAAHVSKPHQGSDALYMAAQTVVAVQALATRLVDPMDQIVIGIGKLNAGDAYNIVAQKAVLEGTLRTFDEGTRARIKTKIEEAASANAAVFEGKLEAVWKDFTSVLINDPAVIAESTRICVEVFGPDRVTNSMPASLGGDDMAEILKQVPGCYAQVGVADPDNEQSSLPLHHEKIAPDERALETMIALHLAQAAGLEVQS